MNTGCRRRMLLLSLPLALLVSAAAQDTQRVEVFGGYSLQHDNQLLPGAANFSGWDASTTVFLNRWLGATVDFSGHYGSDTYTYPPSEYSTGATYRNSASTYNFLLGPHFTYHRSRYAPFAQALFGVHDTYESETVLVQETCLPPTTCTGLPPAGTKYSNATTKFAMAIGGGLDIDLGHGISLRPVQAEYLLQRECCDVEARQGVFHSYGFNDNAFRYSAGIVFHFGSHLGKN
jgi:opacity protein-like surface antigen